MSTACIATTRRRAWQACARRWDEVLAKSRQGSLLRSGVHVVIAGRPKVGKSSLLNRLAGEERAIVAAVPGTTRDALRESIQIEGVPLVIVDTAGLHASRDEVEQLGMERTAQRDGARGSAAVGARCRQSAAARRNPAGRPQAHRRA
jgi:tRNA U34 5-carboxymethylaminomethyl modifying GTPase MnmE/TrmE